MAKQRRAWFFDAPLDGDRFRTQNIPSQTTYAELLESIPFFKEGTSMATNHLQGLVMINDDATVIKDRNNAVVNAGKQYVLTRWQAPGTGVNDGGTYKESDPVDAWTDGPSVSGAGMKITGKSFSFGGGRRIGYQVELDVNSLQDVVTADFDKLEFPVYDPVSDKHYKLVLGSDAGKAPLTYYEHTQDVGASSWTINHGLGKRPVITVTQNDLPPVGNGIVEGQIEHPTLNQATVTFNSIVVGKAQCSI